MDDRKLGIKSPQSQYSSFYKSSMDAELPQKMVDNFSTTDIENSTFQKNSNFICQKKTIKYDSQILIDNANFLEEIAENDGILDRCVSKKVKCETRTNVATKEQKSEVENSSLDVSMKKNTSEFNIENCSPLDLWKPVYTNSIFVCLYNIVNVKHMFQSPPKHISGVPWRLYVKRIANPDKKCEETLAFYVKCCETKANWKVSANCQLILFTQNSNRQNFFRKTAHFYSEEKNYCGYTNFISMKELTDPNNNYMVNDRIYLEVIIDVNKGITEKEIIEKVSKYLQILNISLRNKQLSDARNICMNAIQCFSQIGSSYVEKFKKKLNEITNRQLYETIERIENIDLKNGTRNEKILKKESDLKKICQANRGNKNNTMKTNSNDSDSKKIGNSDLKENDNLRKKNNDYKVQGKIKKDPEICECKFNNPDIMYVCENCQYQYDSKTFFYHLDNEKIFYYSVYGSRSYLTKIFLRKFSECESFYLDYRIVPVEKLFNKGITFDSTMESPYSKRMTYINKNVGKFILNIQKNKSELKKVMMTVMNACENRINDNTINCMASMAQDHFIGMNVFDDISPNQFVEYPIGKVMEYIKNNACNSVKIFKSHFNENELQNFNNILDTLSDPNIEKIFQNSDNHLCLFPTMWLTVISQALDLWLNFYTKSNIVDLSQQLFDANTEINKLVKNVQSLNVTVEKKKQSIEKLNKKLEQIKKPSEKLNTANNRILELEKSVASLRNQNKSLISQNKQLSNEIGLLKSQCKDYEIINNEKDARYNGLKKSLKAEKIKLEQENKSLKNRCKKLELSILDKAYNIGMKDLKNVKNEAVKKLEGWNTLSKDISERNSDTVLRNKNVLNDYISNISNQIQSATDNYKENSMLIEEGKLISQIGKIKIKNTKTCPPTNCNHLLKLQNLEVVMNDEISVFPLYIFKKKGDIKNMVENQTKNQINLNYFQKQNELPSNYNASQSKVFSTVNDVFSNCGHFDQKDLKQVSNNSRHYSSNNSGFSDDLEKKDCNFNDSFSSIQTDTESVKEGTVFENNNLSSSHITYNNFSTPGFVNEINDFFVQINPTISFETNDFNSSLTTDKSSTSFPGNAFSFVDNYRNSLFSKPSDILPQIISNYSDLPFYSFLSKQLYEPNFSNWQIIPENQLFSNQQDDIFVKLLKDFSSEHSNDKMW